MDDEAHWGAVWAMALGVGGLVTAELLPASLLTPIARDLGITEGLAGQSVSATAAVALVTSLLTAPATRRLDRRPLLIGCSVFLAASSVVAATAHTLLLLLVGRILLGAAIGAFWSIAAATAMRLVPGPMVARALSIIFSAGSVATVIAAPLGSVLGAHVGWRGVFLIPAVLGVATAAWQLATLPSMVANADVSLRTLVDVVRRPSVGAGLAAAMLSFAGHFAFFTYLRPFLETITGVGVTGLSIILLAFGLAGFVGTTLAPRFVEGHPRRTLTLAPLVLAAVAVSLIAFGAALAVASPLVALWGMAFGIIPVGWSIWITRVVPDQAEVGGGILVAAIQVAIAAGAAMGGYAFDNFGARAAFAVAAVAVLLAALSSFTGLRDAP